MRSLIHQIFFRHAAWTAVVLYALCLLIFQPNFPSIDQIFYSLSLNWGEPTAQMIYPFVYLGYVWAYLSSWGLPFDIYSLFILIVNGACLYLIAKTCIQTELKPCALHYFAWFVVLYLISLPFLLIAFTSVSLIAMAVGTLCLIHSTRERRGLASVLFVAFILLAAMIRFDSSLGVLPFLIVVCFWEFIQKNRRFLPYIMVVILGIIGMHQAQIKLSIAPLWGNPEASLLEIHQARVSFCDYPDFTNPQDIDAKEKAYLDQGFSSLDRELVSNMTLISTQRHSIDWWQDLGRIRKSGQLYDKYYLYQIKRRLLLSSGHFKASLAKIPIYIYIPLILLCLPMRWSTRWRILSLWGMMLLLFCICALRGRLVPGVMSGLWYVSLILILAYLPNKLHQKEPTYRLKLKLMLFFLVGMAILFKESVLQRYPANYPAGTAPLISFAKASYYDQDTHDAIVEECARHPELLYFTGFIEWRYFALPTHVLWKAHIHKISNFLPYIEWHAASPAYEQFIRSHGITSDRDIPYLDHARFIIAQIDQESEQPELFASWLGNRVKRVIAYEHKQFGRHLKLVHEKKLTDRLSVYRLDKTSAVEYHLVVDSERLRESCRKFLDE